MNSSNLRKYTIRINRWRFVSCCFLVTPFFMMQSFVLISVSPFLFPLIYIITLSRRISFRNNFSTSFSKDFDDPVIVWSVLKRTFRMKNKKIDCDCESQLYHITFSTTTTQTPTKWSINENLTQGTQTKLKNIAASVKLCECSSSTARKVNNNLQKKN